MNHKLNFKNIPNLVMILLLIDIGFCIVYIGNIIAGKPIDIFTTLVKLESEDSLSTWYSSIQLFCIFIFSSIFTYYHIKKKVINLHLLIFPAMFLFMSADEIVQMHEWLGVKSDYFFSLGNRRETPFPMTGIWIFTIGLPFLIFFLLYAYLLKINFPEYQSSIKKLIIGMLIMLSGALGLELLSNFIDARYWSVEVVLEEGLEMIGATIMLWAVYDVAKSCYLVKQRCSTQQV